jgi:MFS family permease
VTQSLLVTLIGLGFTAVAVALIVSGHSPWTSPDPWTVMAFFAGCAAIGFIETVQRWWPPKPVDTETRFAAGFNRAQLSVFAIGGALWCVSGVLGLYGSVFPAWAAWLTILFGAVCAGLLGVFALDGREQVAVDRDGILDRRIVTAKIPWGDVERVDLPHVGDVPPLALTLANPALYKARRPFLARLSGRSVDPVQITGLQLTASTAQIATAVTRFAPPQVFPPPEPYCED